MGIEYKDSKRIVKLSTDNVSIDNVVTTTQSLSNEETRFNTGNAKASGQYFTSSASLIGETVTEFTLYLDKQGTVTSGDVVMGVYSQSTGELLTEFTTYNVSQLTTSFAPYTATSTVGHTLQAGDVVGYKWNGVGNGSVQSGRQLFIACSRASRTNDGDSES